MDVFEKILQEIDAGINTIKALLEGETRKIAENQIIGMEEAKKIVEKHKKDSVWIPVEQRLPEHGINVIVCRKNGRVEQGCLTVNGYWHVYGTRIKSVIAWMPLPDTYREEE